MMVNRLRELTSIGVDKMSTIADRLQSERLLRLENLDTDLPPPQGVFESTKNVIGMDDANSYLPFFGSNELRQAATDLVTRLSGVNYDWNSSTIISAGGLNGILNVLLALVEDGDEVIMTDPIYVGLVNRVRLAGGVPLFLPYKIDNGVWKLDFDQLGQAISLKTKVFLMMSPSMPTGAVLSRQDWEAICAACCRANAWLLYDSAMERILYDGLEYVHPASVPGMAERTITVGSVSKEYRMIGWRVGWIVAPPNITSDIGLVTVSNVVCPVGIAQKGAAIALQTPDYEIALVTEEWQRRRDTILEELQGFAVVKPQGGWSMLMDASSFGLSGAELSKRMLDKGQVAATAMTGWGSKRSDRFVRFVFSNEPVERLKGLRNRVEAAIGKPRIDRRAELFKNNDTELA
jgi:N-succinyldiaminopimelate aminotransferase